MRLPCVTIPLLLGLIHSDGVTGQVDYNIVKVYSDKVFETIGITGDHIQKVTKAIDDFGDMAPNFKILALSWSATIGFFAPPDPKKPPPPPVDPKKLDEILNAMKIFENVLTVGFDRIDSRVTSAVNEIEAHQQVLDWGTNVLFPMIQLAAPAKNIFTSNFSSGFVEQMAIVCKSHTSSPLGIAQFIWSRLGAACNGYGNGSDLLQGAYCDIADPRFFESCRRLPTACIAETFVQADDYDHKTADYLFNLTVDTVLELSTYHSTCVNFTWKDDNTINDQIRLFSDQAKQIITMTPKIVERAVEKYWPDIAKAYGVEIVASGKSIAVTNKLDDVWDAFNDRYTWYNYSIVECVYADVPTVPVPECVVISLYDSTIRIEASAPRHLETGFGIISRYKNMGSDAKDRKFKTNDWLLSEIDTPNGRKTVNSAVYGMILDWKSPEEIKQFLDTFAGGAVAENRFHTAVIINSPDAYYEHKHNENDRIPLIITIPEECVHEKGCMTFYP